MLVAGAAIVLDRNPLRRLDALMLGALAAFVAWTALSALWAPGAALPIDAAELALVYLAGTAAFLVLTPHASPAAPAVGVLVGVLPIAAYALATRLVPDHVGSYDPAAGGYLLATLIGYSNALGLLCSLAALVALGLVAHAERLAVRAAAAVLLVVTIPTLYFTFSRGASAALLAGILVAAALDPRRLRFSLGFLVALPLPLLGAWLGSRYGSLTHAGAPRAAAAHDGHRVALALAVLAVLQAAAVTALAALERRVTVTPRLRLAYLAVLAAVALAALAGGLVRIGNPVTFLGRATDAFRTDEAATGGDLNRRLVTLSSHERSDYWSAAWREVRDHPVLGGGANTFRRYWLRYRPVPLGVLNAHNLYLETLADLGPVGLALLLAALGVPLLAAVRARGRPLVAAAAGGYAAFLAHAAVDWDWQLPAVTLAGLACAATLVAAARPEGTGRPLGARTRVAALGLVALLAAFLFVVQIGNGALAASDRAAARDAERRAADEARRARGWLPWSAEPWQRLGEAQLAEGNVEAARATFRKAIGLDREDWSLWLDLAEASTGAERGRALAEARRLDPLNRAIQGLEP